jgi:DNA-binding NtrC family response regulator
VADVNAGRFGQDLYYRLRVIEIRVPPLARSGRKATGFTPRAANQLVRYGWPGNVRELENAVERAVVVSRGGRIDVEDLPEEVSLALPGVHAAGTVLRANDGNKTRAAEQLKIGAATLYRKLKGYKALGGVA